MSDESYLFKIVDVKLCLLFIGYLLPLLFITVIGNSLLLLLINLLNNKTIISTIKF